MSTPRRSDMRQLPGRVSETSGLSRPARRFPTPLFATHDPTDTCPDVATDTCGESHGSR